MAPTEKAEAAPPTYPNNEMDSLHSANSAVPHPSKAEWRYGHLSSLGLAKETLLIEFLLTPKADKFHKSVLRYHWSGVVESNWSFLTVTLPNVDRDRSRFHMAKAEQSALLKEKSWIWSCTLWLPLLWKFKFCYMPRVPLLFIKIQLSLIQFP